MTQAALGRPRSFRARLTLRWTLAAGLLLGTANLAIYGAARVYLDRWLDGHVRTLAATEAASSTDGAEDVHLHERFTTVAEAGAFAEKFVQIFGDDGELVLQSTTLAVQPPAVPPEIVAAALEGQEPMVSTTVAGRPIRMAVLPAARGDRRFAVAVGVFADDVEAGLASLVRLLLLVWTISLAATATIGYVIAGRALAPVAQIAERAAWIAQGHFGARLDVPAVADEVGRMTVLLNSMLDRLQDAVDANRRFASDASHELRGPLTALAGEVDVALRHPRDAGDYREALEFVRGRVVALTRLAEDLILLARTQEGARDLVLREIDLQPLVRESFRRLESPARDRRIDLHEADLSGIQAYADPALLGRVVDNVIANAVHHNRDGGSVFVSATVEEPPEDGSWASTMVCLTVRDTGPGIPASDRERVFERFVRLDRSRARRTGGSGLGLAISREVLALHGGAIRVANSSDDGTVIEIRLPGRRTGPASSLAG